MGQFNKNKSKIPLLIRMAIVLATAYVVYRIGAYIV